MQIAFRPRHISQAIWLFFAIISLIATTYFSYHYFQTKNTLVGKAREHAQQETVKASLELDKFINMLKPLAQFVADKLSSSRMNKEQIELLLKKVKPIEAAGLGVAFLPYKYDEETKLYAPYLFEQGGKEVMTHLEKMYDYTQPEHKWLHKSIKRGPGFSEPYYGAVSKTILAEYAVPFYQTDDSGKKYVAGIVYANQSVEHLQHILDSLFLGKEGYWFILTKKGYFLAHPQDQLVHKQVSIFDLAKKINNPDLAQVGTKIGHKERVFFEYNNEITGAPSWLFSEPIEGTSWSIVGVFDKSELGIRPSALRRNLILPSLPLLLLIVMLILLILSLLANAGPTHWWTASFIISLALVGQIVWTWYATYSYPKYDIGNLYVIENKASLFNYLQKETIQKRYGKKQVKKKDSDLSQENTASFLENPREDLLRDYQANRYIPTGIFVNNVQFVASNRIQISAYVWQRFTDGIHDDIPRGFLLPQSTETTITEMSRTKEGNTETILWEVFAELNQLLKFDRYPFDTKALRIQLWHRYTKKNIVLIPDLNSYQLINPRSLPGIDNDTNLPGWTVTASYFGYKKVNYTSNFGTYTVGPFGIYESVNKSEVPELYFDILASRHLVDTLVADLLPVCVIAVLLFVILLTSTQQGFAIIGWCASVFFAAVFAQIRFRAKIPQTQVVYFESFYFLMYIAILVILLVMLLYQLNFNIPFIRYRKNMIAKLLYWPTLFTTLSLITLWYLY